MDPLDPHAPRSSESAGNHLQEGDRLRAQGKMDAALTEYRRAVLNDPKLFPAQLAIGYLCKAKASQDRLFLRHALTAFHEAARLDLNHQEAHDQYIMISQQMNLLEEVHAEYDAWSKANPENLFLKRCVKNIITLTMAMIPANVSIKDSGSAASMRKLLLFASIGVLVLGVALIFGPTLLSRTIKTITPDSIRTFVRIGLFTMLIGISGFVIRGQIK